MVTWILSHLRLRGMFRAACFLSFRVNLGCIGGGLCPAAVLWLAACCCSASPIGWGLAREGRSRQDDAGLYRRWKMNALEYLEGIKNPKGIFRSQKRENCLIKTERKSVIILLQYDNTRYNTTSLWLQAIVRLSGVSQWYRKIAVPTAKFSYLPVLFVGISLFF